MIESVLTMENLYFSEFDFQRQGNIRPFEYDELKLGFGKKSSLEDEIMTLKIMLKVLLDDAFELNLTTTGVFKCTSKDISVSSFEKNAMSILFPYIRSEVTLLTSQPNFKPITIPPININALYEKILKEYEEQP